MPSLRRNLSAKWRSKWLWASKLRNNPANLAAASLFVTICHFCWSLINRHLFQLTEMSAFCFGSFFKNLFVQCAHICISEDSDHGKEGRQWHWHHPFHLDSLAFTPLLTAALRRHWKINNAAAKMQIWRSDVLQMSISTTLLPSQHASKGEILNMTRA